MSLVIVGLGAAPPLRIAYEVWQEHVEDSARSLLTGWLVVVAIFSTALIAGALIDDDRRLDVSIDTANIPQQPRKYERPQQPVNPTIRSAAHDAVASNLASGLAKVQHTGQTTLIPSVDFSTPRRKACWYTLQDNLSVIPNEAPLGEYVRLRDQARDSYAKCVRGD